MSAQLAPPSPSALSAQGGRADPWASLNPQQRQAVEHGVGDAAAPALLVIAGAGSGKTLTLASRVARLIAAGADPQRLLLLTFSRRAAHEMEQRVAHVLSQWMGSTGNARPPSLPWSGTFHAVGARLLREQAAQIGLAEQFTILDRSDAEDHMGLVRQALGFAATHQRFPMKGTCLSIYSRVVNSREPLGRVLQQHFPWCGAWEAELKALFKAYAAAKRDQQVLDYDDLLLYWAQMMGDDAIAAHLGQRFTHVLVDEYQDTNRLQAEILQRLKPDGRGLTVVGDDAQAIYGFRAAEVRNILDFPQQFDPPARVLPLERNYRSTQAILDVSNAVIALAAERHAKQLWTDRQDGARPQLVSVEDDRAQARWVADRVLDLREGGLTLKRQAVLFRTSHHSAALELELIRRNIPFVKYGGLKFLEAAHVKDVLSLLRWAQNPRNRLAGWRVVQLVPGLGPASARRLLDAMQGSAEPLHALHAFKPPSAAASDWAALAQAYTALHTAGADTWPDDVQQAVRWYQPHLERLHADAPVRLADLVQLGRLAGGHANRERFLAELTLDPPEATSDEPGPPLLDEDYLILSTIHSAKGQEWQSVTLLNAVDGCIPSEMSTGDAQQIEEERRLLYVALTRARQHLHVMVPQRFCVTEQRRFGDAHIYGSLTRFAPEAVQRLFDVVGPMTPREEPGRGPQAHTLPTIDVAARVQSMWD